MKTNNLTSAEFLKLVDSSDLSENAKRLAYITELFFIVVKAIINHDPVPYNRDTFPRILKLSTEEVDRMFEELNKCELFAVRHGEVN